MVFVAFVLFIIAVGAALGALQAWVVMLILGALSHLLAIPALALGFWPVFLILWLLNIIAGFFKVDRKAT